MDAMSSNRKINSQSASSELHEKNGLKSQGDNANDSWEVVTASKNKRISSVVGPSTQKPPLRRQYSKSVRRVQSGDVLSLQQHQTQQHGNNRQKMPNRSQSFVIPQQSSLPASGLVNGKNNRRSSYGPQNSDRSMTSATSNSTSASKRKGPTPRSTSSKVLQGKGKSFDDITLYNVNGSGMTIKEMQVVRLSADLLLSYRTKFTDAPLIWTPHNRCHWQGPDRIRQIEQEQSLYYHFTPLKVDNQTRWKPKVVVGATGSQPQVSEDQDAVKIARITSILNKLSWTNLNKLTGKFIEELGSGTPVQVGISEDESQTTNIGTHIAPELIQKSMKIVVEKAVMEPHFAELYAKFSAKLATVHKQFRKSVQKLCEEKFKATEMVDKDLQAEVQSKDDSILKNVDNTEAKKRSIGLMKFIGELYLMDIFRTSIMLSCCECLLCPNDEEKLESFCKLMSTIGKKLQEEHHKNGDVFTNLWNNVYCMAGKAPQGVVNGPVAPNTRMKFFLQSLIELKENNWIQVRHEHEKAQTIEQIHAQAADEAKRGPIVKTTSSMLLLRSQSNDQLLSHSESVEDPRHYSSPRRSKSEIGNKLLIGKNSVYRKTNSPSTLLSTVDNEQKSPSTQSSNAMSCVKGTAKNFSITQCADKTKVILKEFFVSGDRDEAVLSIDEIIDINTSGHLKRGKAVVTAAILLVLEMKEVHVRKFLDVVSKLLDDQKIDRTCLAQALMDPLDFLRDIEIDAPQAPKLLAIIIADWLTKKVDDGETAISSMDFLLNSSKNFRKEGNAATFAAQILKAKGSEITNADVFVIESLITKDECERYGSIKAFFEANSLLLKQ